MNFKKISKNIVRTLPVFIGYLVLGTGFGVMLSEAGYGIGWAIGMAVTMYTGALQYVAVGFLSNHTNIITVALTTVMINARYFVYSISIIDKYKNLPKAIKPYMIFGLTDETFTLICGSPELDVQDKFQISMFDHIYWVIGCTAGVLLGEFLPFDLSGCGFSLTALFVAAVVDQWMTCKDHVPAIIGISASVVCALIFTGYSFLIPSIIIIMAGLYLVRRFKKEKKQDV